MTHVEMLKSLGFVETKSVKFTEYVGHSRTFRLYPSGKFMEVKDVKGKARVVPCAEHRLSDILHQIQGEIRKIDVRTRKVAAIEVGYAADGKTLKQIVRTPWFRDMRYTKPMVIFNQKKHFRADGNFAERPLLIEKLLPEGTPFWEISTKEIAIAAHIANRGWFVDGDRKKLLTAYWRENKGMRGILVNRNCPVSNLAEIGIYTEITKTSQATKVGKYVHRLTVPVEFYGFGRETSYEVSPIMDMATVHLDNNEDLIVVSYDIDDLDPDTKALVDGFIAVSPSAFRKLGWKDVDMPAGFMCNGHVGTQHWMAKGNIAVVPQLDVDIVAFGPKKIVATDIFYIGIFGELHDRIPHSDVQAWDALRFERPGLIEKQASTIIREFWDASNDFLKTAGVLLRHIQSSDREYYEENATYDAGMWPLKYAISRGLPLNRFPWLASRAMSFWFRDTINMTRGRVPLDRVAEYAYIAPDPAIFDSMGRPDVNRSNIPEGHCVFMNRPDGEELCAYRQPIAHGSEKIFLTNINSSRYASYEDRNVFLMGKGAARYYQACGGADNDDCFIILFDPDWVKAMHSVAYPTTEKIVAYVDDEEFAPIYSDDDLLKSLVATMPGNETHYTLRHFQEQLDEARRRPAGIGPVVNAIMIDNRLSNPEDVAYMLSRFDAKIEKFRAFPEMKVATDLLIKCREWLRNRKPYQLAHLATNLELIIDAAVKDPALLAQLGNVQAMLRQFHYGVIASESMDDDVIEGINEEGTLVYPWVVGLARRGSRIPLRRRQLQEQSGNKLYVITETLMCSAIKRIQEVLDIYVEASKEKEWRMVEPIPEALDDMFPSDQFTNDQVDALLKAWKQSFRDSRDEEVDVRALVMEADSLIIDMLDGLDDDQLCYIAVELARRYYHRGGYNSARVGEDGKRWGFSDRLLGVRPIANAFIYALERAGLTGKYVPVELFKDVRNLYNSTVKVRVGSANVVYRMSDDTTLGVAQGTIGEGEYLMYEGIIEVKKPHPDLYKQEDMEEIDPNDLG